MTSEEFINNMRRPMMVWTMANARRQVPEQTPAVLAGCEKVMANAERTINTLVMQRASQINKEKEA